MKTKSDFLVGAIVITCFVLVLFAFLWFVTTDNEKLAPAWNKQQIENLNKANTEMKKWQAKNMNEAKQTRKHIEQGPKWPVEKQ